VRLWSENLFLSFLHVQVIVRYPSVSLSPILSRNEKVEQHIRKKTHKPNALRFWVEGGVIPLSGFGSVIILCEISSVLPPRILPTSGIRAEGSWQ